MLLGVIGIVVGIAAATPVYALNFHLMQFEQVIGGVNGDTTAQAVQLRMRLFGQNFVTGVRLIAWDAAGQNPVVLLDFPGNVSNNAAGARILIASSNFASLIDPSITPDFIMTNLIPAEYLAVGSITYEDNFTIWWRLSWGGANYTGPNTGSNLNDGDGNFGPPWPGPLPSTCARALQFQGEASALSTNNAADYALTAGAAIFTNNANAAGTVTAVADACCEDSECDDGDACNGLETCQAGLCVEGTTFVGGAVPNGATVPGIPLTLQRANIEAVGDITLNWGASCSPSDDDYEIYEGLMSGYYSHVSRFCSTGGATTITFAPIAGDSYYLVVPRNTLREGSYSLDGGGAERPQGASACLPQLIGACP